MIEKRKSDAEKARQMYPHKLPLIIEKAPDQKKLDSLKNPK